MTAVDAALPVVREPTLTPVGTVLVVTSADGSVYGVDLAPGRCCGASSSPTVARHVTRSGCGPAATTGVVTALGAAGRRPAVR